MTVKNVNTQNYNQLFSQVTAQAKAKKVNVSIFDTNKDGKFSIGELQKALAQLESDQPLPQETPEQQAPQEEKGFFASIGSFFSGLFGGEEDSQQQLTSAQAEGSVAKNRHVSNGISKIDSQEVRQSVNNEINNTQQSAQTSDDVENTVEAAPADDMDGYTYKGKTENGLHLYVKIVDGQKEEVYKNEKGQKVKEITFNKNGSFSKLTFYDENGKRTSMSEYGLNGKNTKTTYYNHEKISFVDEYDENGKVSKTTKYDEKGNISSTEEYQYKNGEKITTKTNKNGKFQIEYDKDGNVKKLTVLTEGKESKVYEGKEAQTLFDNLDSETFNDLLGDGQLGTNSVQQTGNCWLHADINAVMQTEKGREYLNKLVSKDPKTGDITVFLPGAKAKGLPQPKGDGIYTYSEKDLLNRIKDTSAGDGEYTALVCAVEDYVRENSEDVNANTESSINPNYTREEIQKVIFGAGFTTTKDINYDDLKDKINSKNYAISCGLNNDVVITGERDGQPFTLLDGHAYTIVGMDDNSVTLMESNNPDKPIKVSKDEFMKMSRVNISDVNNLPNVEDEKNIKGIVSQKTENTNNGTRTTTITRSGDIVVEERNKDGKVIKRTRSSRDGETTVDFSENTRKRVYKEYGATVFDAYKDGKLVSRDEVYKDRVEFYKYNSDGSVNNMYISYRDGRSSMWKYEYDENGNKIREIYESETSVCVTEYDVNGKEISSTWTRKDAQNVV